ncbi:MAG: OmpA family protein [Ferruginibacter sp.]|nr:OmpA family protein [Cytophagales bacterium]
MKSTVKPATKSPTECLVRHVYPVATILLLGLALWPGVARAQSNVRAAEKIARQGDKHLKSENYHRAWEYYDRALALDSNSVRALANGGVANLLLYANPQAACLLQKACDLDPRFDDQLRYWLGRAYHLTGQTDQAVNEYNKYLQTLPAGDSRRDEVNRLLTQARFLKTYAGSPTDHTVQNLGENLNSAYADYSPILTSDEKTLIFTSRRTEEKKTTQTPRGDDFEKMYSATRFFDGSWGKPTLIGDQHNKKNHHVSNVQLFDHDRKLLVYRSDRFGSLMTAEREGAGWSEPVALNKFTVTRDYESSGFVYEPDSSVYFASSKDSKDGNLDLFVTRKETAGQWSAPQRLSPLLNTDQDEDAPFLAADGQTLYFSSRGHDGMGGYDVFKATYNPANRTWSRPVNLGYPTNSPADDIYYVANDSTGVGYVSSNRMGTLGGPDIFRVSLPLSVVVNGYVTNRNNQQPLPGYTIQLTPLTKKEDDLVAVTRSNGQYSVRVRSKNRYRLQVLRQEEVVLTEELDVPLAINENVRIVRDFPIDVPVSALPPAVARITVANLNLIRVTYQELDSLVIDGSVKHTGQPIANAQVGLREEASAEIKYRTTTDGQGNYHLGFIPGKPEDYVVEITQPGYQLASVVVLYAANQPRSKAVSTRNKNVNRIDLSTALVALEVGAKSVLGGVYFEFNSAVLRPESAIVLDRLRTFLNDNPTVRMEIGGHSDDVGTSYVNRTVSQKRAQSVVNYLISKGITKNRLTSHGYGEDAPAAPNDAEMNGRDVNRRVEITILAK